MNLDRIIGRILDAPDPRPCTAGHWNERVVSLPDLSKWRCVLCGTLTVVPRTVTR